MGNNTTDLKPEPQSNVADHALVSSAPNASKPAEEEVIQGEIHEISKYESPSVDPNYIIANAIAKAKTPEQTIMLAREAMKVSAEYEEMRTQLFERRTNAIVEYKRKDPEEIEKRKSNSVRRFIKICVSSAMLMGVVTTLVSMILGGLTPSCVAVSILLIGFSIFALAQSGPMASGESVSSNDIVRIIKAFTGFVKSTQQEENTEQVKPTNNRKDGNPSKSGRKL